MNRRALAALVAASGLLLAGLAVGLVVVLIPRETLSLSALLDRTDGYIARSFHDEARGALSRAAVIAVSAEDMLRVLKREALLAGRNGGYRPLKEYALACFSRHPRHAELCRIALWACLRDGDQTAAAGLALGGHRDIPEVQALEAELLAGVNLTENIARSGAGAVGDERLPARLLAAGRALNDDRFFLDAALAFLARGETGAARRIAGTLLLKPAYDEPAGMIAYEQGDYAQAAARLTAAAERVSRPELFIIAADALALSGDNRGAAGLYDRALRLAPDFSAAPYVGLARFFGAEDDSGRARELLEQATALFPDDRTATAEYAKLLYRRGERSAARRLLDARLAKHPDDFDLLLLRLRFADEELSPDRYLVRLREIYFSDPQQEPAAAALVAAFLEHRDPAAARAVLTHFREASGPAPRAWALAAEGIALAAEGEVGRADALLGEAARLEDRWEYRYNRAVVLEALGNLPEARAELERTMELLAKRPELRPARAAAHGRLAEVYRRGGNRPRAAEEARRALALDAGNAAARRVLKELKPEEPSP